MRKELRQKLVQKFAALFPKRVKKIEDLCSLIQEGEKEAFSELLREVHTLKGESRVLKLAELSEFFHQLEDFLKLCQKEHCLPPKEVWRESLGEISRFLEHFLKEETYKVDWEKLLKEMDASKVQVGEKEEKKLWRFGWERTSIPWEVLEGLSRTIDELEQWVRRIRKWSRMKEKEGREESLPHLLEELEGVLDRLFQFRSEVFLTPFSEVLAFIREVVEELSERLGKQVELKVQGAEVKLDKNVLEKLIEPLLHLVQNAIDHGIESPQERRLKGKKEVGTLSLQLRMKERFVEICFSDDGQGIDWEAVKEKAIREGRISPEQEVSEEELKQLLFSRGFSTREEVSLVSGRGLGLDVVQHTVESLGGSFSLFSKKGQGTTFVLKIPARQRMLSCFLFRVASFCFLLPASAVQKVGRIKKEEIHHLGKGVLYGKEHIPLYFFHEFLGVSPPVLCEGLPFVWFSSLEGESLWVIDEWVGEDTLWIKPLNSYLLHPWIVGGSLLPTGELAFFFSPERLLHRKEVKTVSLARKEKEKKTVLLVEDSWITRQMEKNLLLSLGVEVVEAENGQKGWEIFQTQAVDLVVTDLEMPLLDGVELTRRIKQGERNVPVILVTTRGAPEEIQKGLEAGADAYFVKGEFQPETFLEKIQEWLE